MRRAAHRVQLLTTAARARRYDVGGGSHRREERAHHALVHFVADGALEGRDGGREHEHLVRVRVGRADHLLQRRRLVAGRQGHAPGRRDGIGLGKQPRHRLPAAMPRWVFAVARLGKRAKLLRGEQREQQRRLGRLAHLLLLFEGGRRRGETKKCDSTDRPKPSASAGGIRQRGRSLSSSATARARSLMGAVPKGRGGSDGRTDGRTPTREGGGNGAPGGGARSDRVAGVLRRGAGKTDSIFCVQSTSSYSWTRRAISARLPSPPSAMETA